MDRIKELLAKVGEVVVIIFAFLIMGFMMLGGFAKSMFWLALGVSAVWYLVTGQSLFDS